MCDETESKKKKNRIKDNIVVWSWFVVRKDCVVVFTASQFPYVILCPNLMTVQNRKKEGTTYL